MHLTTLPPGHVPSDVHLFPRIASAQERINSLQTAETGFIIYQLDTDFAICRPVLMNNVLVAYSWLTSSNKSE